jgi:hypothetical protein
MNAQDAKDYCREDVTLERLTIYIDTMRPVDPVVKLFYGNLVNNPTHSYRIEHLDLGFNGCTGRVDEHVALAGGGKRDNVFIFNDQGLLTRSIIQGSKGKTEVNYTYSYDDVLGFTIKQSKSKNHTINYAPIYGEHGRRECIKASNGQRQDYTYNEQGHLAKLVITPAKGDKRTLLYQDGYVVREETGGKAYRYFYDFDTATGKKFLIAINELKGTDVVHERTFDYQIDTHGRYTSVVVSLDGKRQMTITRTYSD